MHRVGALLLLMTASLLLAATAFGAGSPGYYQFPDIHGDKVAFSSEGDLWLKDLTVDGPAIRLTRHDGGERFARFSPDGRWIAFTGEYDGNDDVYLIPVSGGAPKRLTFHPGQDVVIGWTNDGKHIIFRTDRFQAVDHMKLYLVSPEGGYPEDIGLDKASRISYSPNGVDFAYTRMLREDRPNKRYVGGWAMDVWTGNMQTLQFEKLTDFEGTDFFPMWIGDRIYYMSDRSGRTNIFSMLPDGGDLKQHTFYEEWDARYAATDGSKIVYQLGADIYAYDVATGQDNKLDIVLPSDQFRARDRRIDDPDDYISGYSIPDNGKRLALAARGEVFTFPVAKKGYIRRLTNTPGARDKYVAFSPDGKQVAIMSDASGEMEIWLAPSGGGEPAKQLTKGGTMWRSPMKWSPDGKWLLFTDKAYGLWIADAESGKLTRVNETNPWYTTAEVWSPDSKWIAWVGQEENEQDMDVFLYNLDTKKRHEIDRPMTVENNVDWDADGNYLYLLSENWFNPVLSQVNSTFIYDQTSKIYIALLAKDTENPFDPVLVEAFEEEEEEAEADDEEDTEDEKDESITVDLDGLSDRIYPVPIDAANIGGLVGISGKLYYTTRDNKGMMPEGGRGDHTLHLFDLEEKESEAVTSGYRAWSLSPNKEKLVLWQKSGGFVVMDAGAAKVPDEDGHVSLSGWSFEIDPRDEWAQILKEIWRWQRDFFYDPDMHGVDWESVYEDYSSLVPRLGDREELNDIISQMIGELSAGHAYIFGGDQLSGKSYGVGRLGADIQATGNGPMKVTHILYGDGWGDEPVSPLKGKVEVGEYLVAVDGVPLERDTNIFELLQDKAGKEVLLSVNDKPTTSGARDVLIETMRGEGKLRYLDWVRKNREYVDEISGGKVAYVHMPNMGGMGLSMWGRMYYPQVTDKALLVDVRYNHGGFIATMVLNQLQHQVWSVGKGREGEYGRVPNDAFYGPKAALCCHETWSDGETFSEGFKRLDLGPLFGTRTWGGWVGIRGARRTVDKGGNTQPEFTGWGAWDGHWLIEGPGVSPDVEVEAMPADMIRGEDKQIDTAVEYLLKELANKEKWPDFHPLPEYPDKSLKIQHMR